MVKIHIGMTVLGLISMSVLTVGPKCTLARVVCCPLVSYGEYANETDR